MMHTRVYHVGEAHSWWVADAMFLEKKWHPLRNLAALLRIAIHRPDVCTRDANATRTRGRYGRRGRLTDP